MSLFTEYEFSKCVRRYHGDRHAIKFNCRDHFLVMNFAQFTNRSGLRDIETTLDLCSQDLYRSGLKIMPKSTLAELYRERWQIEIFFKWIKQHLHIKTFSGTSQNAVYTQIWIAVCEYLLLIIAKKKYELKPTLHTISNSIGQILFKRGDIRDFYNKPDELLNISEEDSCRQLTLW